MKLLRKKMAVVLFFAMVFLVAEGGIVHGSPYGRVAVVAKSGGDFSNPVAAMNAVPRWCRLLSAKNPCLIRIMPGVYDLGTQTLKMRPYVDIE